MLCGGGFLVVCCLGRCMGLGRPGLLSAEGRVAAGALVSCLCGGGWGGWLPGAWCRKHACRASASCLCGWWGVVGAPACLVRVGVACCRGSGAVRPGCLTRLGLLVVGVLGWVWVGWL